MARRIKSNLSLARLLVLLVVVSHTAHAFSARLFERRRIRRNRDVFSFPQGMKGYSLRNREQSRLRMVLTTPESIIEQASTKKLLDDLIDESVRTTARRTIMMPFSPNSAFLWARWKGTIFSETWGSCVTKMAYALVVFLVCKRIPGIDDYLAGFNSLWGQLLSITTFTLTFFVNQSYTLWRKCYDLSRRLQGRLQDIDMSLAAHACREPGSGVSEPSSYTSPARQLLELVARYVRLFNLLTYASFTRSHRPILTPRGMRRLVERGIMTQQELQILVDLKLPATQRHHAVLLWILRSFLEGREAGHFLGGAGFEEQIIEKFHVTRQQYGAISDELHGRMPLAYSHIVQVLVDVILYMYPFMAFTSKMSPLVSVIGTGLLTISYQGLFDLSKQFLDPYDNESYGKGEDPLVVDTLIAETNAASVRWLYGLEQMPVPTEKIRNGDLSDFLLPLRGYSVEECNEMEEERLKREIESKKARIREEMDRQAAEAMIDALVVSPTITVRLPGKLQFREAFSATPFSPKYTIVNATRVSGFVDTVASLAPNMLEPLVPIGTYVSRMSSSSQSVSVNGHTETQPPLSKSTPIESIVDDPVVQMGKTQIKIEQLDAAELDELPAEFTTEEYEQEHVDLLKEMLETEAILNAPPAADFVEIPGQPEDNDAPDDLAVLEMDELDIDDSAEISGSPGIDMDDARVNGDQRDGTFGGDDAEFDPKLT